MTTVILQDETIETTLDFNVLLKRGRGIDRMTQQIKESRGLVWASIALKAHEEGEKGFTAWWEKEQEILKADYKVKAINHIEGIGAVKSAIATAKKAFKLGIPLADYSDDVYTITPKSTIKEDETLLDKIVALINKEGLNSDEYDALVAMLGTTATKGKALATK